MSIQNDALMSLHAASLRFRAARAEVLANNLTNADTPNFKARDLPAFSDILSQQIDVTSASELKNTHLEHIGSSISSLSNELLYRNPITPSLDGNTVDSATEKVRFAENAMEYQSSLKLLNGRIKQLMSAIRGE